MIQKILSPSHIFMHQQLIKILHLLLDCTLGKICYFNQSLDRVGKNSNHNTDFSFFEKENNGHLFYEYNKEDNFEKFQESDINIKFQQVSDNNYIKRNRILSQRY